ncbi:MAG: hypothetical protein CVU59_11470 [Deltaproteobacteria bacterium HGW-Deltaproteobacteria-17]|nr:MAG: hypothetical protein CVU59_11470 [Deltaproteobacteria bacterium HGW-Deltaproteobacteria-17]
MHASLVILGAVSTTGCTKAAPKAKAPPVALDRMNPAPRSRQIIEGRLVYEEQQVSENQEVRTLRKWVFTVSGERLHVTQGGQFRIEDNLQEIKLMDTVGSSPPAPVAFQIHHPLGREGTFRFRGTPAAAFSALTDPLESLYSLGHFWFSDKLRENLTYVRRLPLTRVVQGQVLNTARDVTYKLKEHAVSRNQNMAIISGSYLNTKMGTLRVGEFELECVGKAEIELEFQLDTGVWTRVDVKEIIGWAGIAFDDVSLAPVNTGHRTITHLQLHLTGN